MGITYEQVNDFCKFNSSEITPASEVLVRVSSRVLFSLAKMLRKRICI